MEPTGPSSSLPFTCGEKDLHSPQPRTGESVEAGVHLASSQHSWGFYPPGTLESAQLCALGSLNYVYSGGQHQRFIDSNKSCSKLTRVHSQVVAECKPTSHPQSHPTPQLSCISPQRVFVPSSCGSVMALMVFRLLFRWTGEHLRRIQVVQAWNGYTDFSLGTS